MLHDLYCVGLLLYVGGHIDRRVIRQEVVQYEGDIVRRPQWQFFITQLPPFLDVLWCFRAAVDGQYPLL